MRILVVEDEPVSLKLAHVILSSDGHQVSGVEAVENAIQAIALDEPEVILLDLQLPRINGLELARKMKADPVTRHIMIITVTAYPERFSRQAALEAGCDAYLVKPIDTRRLTAQVEGVMEGIK